MNDVNIRFQDTLQPVLDCTQCEQRNARGFEFQQKIHVAVWAVRAIGIGTEQFCFLDRVFLRSELHTVFDFLNIQHGTNRPDSDVDLLLEFKSPRISLLTLSAIKYRLEDILKTDVDVIHGPLPSDSMIVIDRKVPLYES